ncbi:hypothetical protein [Streptococcus catagoni]|uniref:hypothetical protein n=1 Tax=Streptococcus catagoni TaxID=2654874 RepID=UPI00140B3CDF|nr:hypothetical protein [Streptococcus catagoni]
MKKKLGMIIALCLSMCAVSVRADGKNEQNKFVLDGPQQKVNEVTVSDFFVGGDEIKIWLPQAWSVKVSRESVSNTKISNKKQKSSSNEEAKFSKRLPYGAQHTVKLSSELKKGERLTFSFTGDDGFYAGSAFYRDTLSLEEDKRYDEEIKKIEDDLERQDQENDALEFFKQQQKEEAKKTWHQRLGDGIQDQWWNFKELFK